MAKNRKWIAGTVRVTLKFESDFPILDSSIRRHIKEALTQYSRTMLCPDVLAKCLDRVDVQIDE